jgi:hypothetical protein
MNRYRSPATTRLLTLTAAALMLSAPALAQQSPPAAAPISPERMQQLAAMRAEAAKLRPDSPDSPRIYRGMQQPEAIEQEPARYTELRDALRAQPEAEFTLQRVPIHPDLRELEKQIPSVRPIDQTRQPGNGQPLLSHFVGTVRSDLTVRDSSVEISIDPALAEFILEGSRWEIEEAKSMIQSMLPAYRHRINEVKAGEDRAEENARRQQLEAFKAKSVTIDWPGGKLSELVKQVRAQVFCNVVLGEATVGDIEVPALSVSSMEPEVFFSMLQTLPFPAGRRISVALVNRNSIDPSSKDRNHWELNGLPAITIVPVAEPAREPVRQVLDLRSLDSEESRASLIEAIEFAMQAGGFTDTVKIRFHEPSKLLFVQGPPQAVDLVHAIVDATKAK